MLERENESVFYCPINKSSSLLCHSLNDNALLINQEGNYLGIDLVINATSIGCSPHNPALNVQPDFFPVTH